MMKAAFAFLVDYLAHNAARKLAVTIDRQFHTGLPVLSPHVSLKQPFVVDDLVGLEAYFDELAADLAPVRLTLPGLGMWTITGPDDRQTGVLYVDVTEDPLLRNLHRRLNHELAERFQNTQAPFDGDQYHFHLTISMGGESADVYRHIYEQYAASWRAGECRVNELVMFYYDDSRSGEFTTHKILPLGGQNPKH